jgi:hypothetical protein
MSLDDVMFFFNLRTPVSKIVILEGRISLRISRYLRRALKSRER